MNIEQRKSVELLTNYWYRYTNRNNVNTVFVGDVHGDFNQFILPLIETETIILTGDVEVVYKSKYPEANIYLPKYVIKNKNINIYYLGDLIDEGLYSRNIIYMINNLFEHGCEIKFCFGNHDLNILGEYFNFQNNCKLSLFKSYYNTLIKELQPYINIRIIGNRCYYKGEENNDFLYEYISPIINCYYNMFIKQYGKIAYNINDMVVSHTIITNRTIMDLINNKSRIRKNYDKKLTDEVLDEKYITILRNYKNEKIEDVINAINNVFYCASISYIGSNSLTYNRLEYGKIFEKNIVGHTEGGLYRSKKLLINPIPTEYDFERKIHTEPVNNVYYFDLNASSGYDIDNVSRPDYFFINKEDKMSVTKTNALRLFYDVEFNKLRLFIYKGKFKFDGINEFEY